MVTNALPGSKRQGEGRKTLRALRFSVETAGGRKDLELSVKRMINAGYVGRDQEEVRRHVEELKREGVPAPETTPTFYPVVLGALTLEKNIEVVGERTSGEAEFVLILDRETWYVGVGSDHTDRELEAVSILKSKQVCPNVLSRELWAFEDVRDHWDQLILRGWAFRDNDRVLYQEARLGAILSPEELVDLIRSRVRDGDLENTVIYSGTVSILTEEIIFGGAFQAELEDPVLARKLTCTYRVKQLDYLS